MGWRLVSNWKPQSRLSPPTVVACVPTNLSRPIRQKWINTPDSKVYGANLGPTWCRQDPGGPHVDPMNLAIWDQLNDIAHWNDSPMNSLHLALTYILFCVEETHTSTCIYIIYTSVCVLVSFCIIIYVRNSQHLSNLAQPTSLLPPASKGLPLF